MKIQIVSDLHLESSYLFLPITDADITAFAGDIAPGMNGVQHAGQHALRTGKPVVYVCGNHEFYRYDINSLRRKIPELTAQPADYMGPAFHFLDNSEAIINGVRFLGCTLWTDFMLFGWDLQEACLHKGQSCLNDFRLIHNGENYFTVLDSIRMHDESVEWLEKKLKREPFAGKTVVISHHAPSYQSVLPRYAKDLLSACFASKLDHLLGFSELWIHGHMHDSLDYEAKGTRVVCNPRGYSRDSDGQENENFNSALVVEI